MARKDSPFRFFEIYAVTYLRLILIFRNVQMFAVFLQYVG